MYLPVDDLPSKGEDGGPDLVIPDTLEQNGICVAYFLTQVLVDPQSNGTLRIVSSTLAWNRKLLSRSVLDRWRCYLNTTLPSHSKTSVLLEGLLSRCQQPFPPPPKPASCHDPRVGYALWEPGAIVFAFNEDPKLRL